MADFFLHIPKTAGRSITRIIQRNYPAGQCLAGQQPGLFFVEDRHSRLPWRKGAREPIDVARQPEDSGILTGHIPYDCIAGQRARFRIFSMLRDPVDRLISEYNHAFTAPHHYLHRRIRDRSITFQDYCLSEFVLTADNVQTRFLAGCHATRGFGEVTSDDCRTALCNLLALEAFGLQERFAESVSLIAWTFGWRPGTLSLDRVGQSEKAVFRRDLDPAFVAEVERRNALDMELHAAASAEFDRRLEASRTAMPDLYRNIPVRASGTEPAVAPRPPGVARFLRSIRRRLG